MRLKGAFSPLALLLFLYVPLLALYAASGESVFETVFESRRAFSWTGLAYFGLALLAFGAGAAMGGDAGRRRPLGALGRGGRLELGGAQRRSLGALLEGALLVSLGAYVAWFAIGSYRAGGPLALLAEWRENPHAVKTVILATVPGVTTLTQLAVAAIPLAVAFGLHRERSVLRKLVWITLALALARAVFSSERLAVIELVVPLAFLALAPRRAPVPKVVVSALALAVAVMAFFAVTELRRTYVYTNDFSAQSATTRFFGYYLTSLNNGFAIVDEYPARTPFYSTGRMLWELPGVGDFRADHLPGVGTVSFRYEDTFGVEPSSFWPPAFAAQDLDYEFNVFSTPGYLAADFGWLGVLAVFLIGAVSGLLYSRADASAFHRALYAVWLVGLLEFMRILYFTDTRLAPAYAVFLAAFLVLRRPSRAPLARPALLHGSLGRSG
jgi:oligosaccharide repeat unit polymerase